MANRYERFQIARSSGQVHIVEVNPKTGRLERTVASVLEGFAPPDLTRLSNALVLASKKPIGQRAVYVNEAIDALNNRP